MSKPIITAARLRELLAYHPENGLFTWRFDRYKCVAGEYAGTIDKAGYIVIVLDGRSYKAHRLVWLYVTGEWPTGLLDHHNRVPWDNVFDNLRDADHAINRQNQGRPQRRNKIGLLGVCAGGKGINFRATIKKPGQTKQTHLGTFKTPEIAHAVYLEAKRKFHPGCTI